MVLPSSSCHRLFSGATGLGHVNTLAVKAITVSFSTPTPTAFTPAMPFIESRKQDISV